MTKHEGSLRESPESSQRGGNGSLSPLKPNSKTARLVRPPPRRDSHKSDREPERA